MDHVQDVLIKTYVSAPIRTPPFIFSRAVLSTCLTWNDLDSRLRENNKSGISFKGFARGRRDGIKLQKGEAVEYTERRCLQRFSTKSVDEALNFILSPDIVSYTSWGSQHVVIDGEKKILPSIPRRFTIKKIFDLYVKSNVPVENKLSESSFYRLTAAVTHGSFQLRCAVDYVVGFLVNDNFESIIRVINHFFLNHAERITMTCEAERLKLFLKYGFDRMILRDHSSTPSCIAHDISHGLGNISSSCRSLCALCRRLFSFGECISLKIKSIDDSVDAPVAASALKAVDGFTQKCTLFMGHRLRVINQHIAIQTMQDEMRLRRSTHKDPVEAHCLLDYKMKTEPTYFREKTVDHYWKRGISYHGAMIEFYSRNDDGSVL